MTFVMDDFFVIFTGAIFLWEQIPQRQPIARERQIAHSVKLFMLYTGVAVRNQMNLPVIRNSCLKRTQASNLQAANCKRIAPAGELLLELKALRLFNNSARSTLPGAEPPAGPEKVSRTLAENSFL